MFTFVFLNVVLWLKYNYFCSVIKPPGTAESQALIFPATDGGDLGSPNNSMMDISDQMLLPPSFPTFDTINHPPAPTSVEDISSKYQEGRKSSASGQVTFTQSSFSGEFDNVVKAEALMSFAPEYGAVETPKSEISSVIFRSPYVPSSRKVDSASKPTTYLYSATPPSSPCFAESDEKSGVPVGLKVSTERNNSSSTFLKSNKHLSHAERGKQQVDGSYNSYSRVEDRVESSQFSNNKPVSDKALDSHGGDNFLPTSRISLATEVECLLCQTSMCRLRHTLLSSRNLSPSGFIGLTGNSTPNQSHFDSSNMGEVISRKSDLKKKEIIPVRIAGDTDVAILDGPSSAPVGVWRSVGMVKGSKTSAPMEVCQPISHNSFVDESMLSYGLRQPLQELLDGVAILVQQATSFVDVSLDADCGDGPYGWLALQEQWRRGFSCGPSMVHAGCGGVLASSHSLDIAGVELVDPLSDDVRLPLQNG